MRFLIVSDMHGNAEALAAVLRHVRRKRFDAVLVLGDLVGYGASPNEVVSAVMELPFPTLAVRGNHDKVVAGLETGSHFNAAARAAARWSAEQLTADHREFLRALPRGPRFAEDGVCICHGSPLDEDQYVFTALDAFEVFATHLAPVTFFGHSHVASAFVQGPNGLFLSALRGTRGEIRLQPGWRYLLNPGAVGQPRDRDPRAAYMTFDSERRVVRWQRIDYPIEKAQRRIIAAGLPSSLAERLAIGI